MSHIETERKFIIKMPRLDALSAYQGYTHSRIEQIYLEGEEHITHRIRRREYCDRVEYTETKKIRISKLSAIEDEREISEREYEELKKSIRYGTHPVIKDRYTVNIDGQLYEIDIYPEWQRTAIMEAELPTEDKEITLPSVFEILLEVSGRREYTNAAMSYTHPKEII